jgi:predicted nucleic acid-binding protein
MLDPARGPFLFDTGARFRRYLSLHPVHVSAITVAERMRGYSHRCGEIISILPDPPTPTRRTHRFRESRQDRIVRWRFDCMIAATALTAGMVLIHNNAADFEAIRSAIESSPIRFPGLGPLELVRCQTLA